MVVLILLLIAVILFVLAGLNIPAGNYNLIAFGLAFFALSFLYPLLTGAG